MSIIMRLLLRVTYSATVSNNEQESRAVAGNPHDAAVIFDP